MTMLGTAVLRLDTDDRPLTAGLARAESQGKAFGSTMSRTMGAIAFAGATAGVTALTVALAGSIKVAMDFDSSLRKVQASTGATSAEMEALRREALKIGADTSKSASQAVEAMGELAKAGMPVETILAGAGRAAVQMAEATGIEVPAAANLMSKALNTFRDDGLDATQAANLFARAANASAIDVSEMGLSLAAVGPVAASAGMTMEDFAVATGLLGNNALRASDAGTSLKAFIAGLTPSSAKARSSMDALGFSAFDAMGNFLPMPEIIGNLQAALAGMTEQQRATTLELWFGSDGVRAANILLKEGTTGWQNFSEAMAQAPSVAEQSAIRMGGLSGSIERFKGALETAAITLGTAFLPILTSLVETVTGIVIALTPAIAAIAGAFDALPAPIQALVVILGSLVGAAAAAATMFFMFSPAIATVTIVAQKLGVTLAALKVGLLALTGVGAVIAILVLLEVKFGLLSAAARWLIGTFQELTRLFQLGLGGGAIGGEFSIIERAAFNLGVLFRDTLIPAWKNLMEAIRLFVLALQGGDIGGKFSGLQQAAFNLGQQLRRFWFEDAKPALESFLQFVVQTVVPNVIAVLQALAREFGDTYADIKQALGFIRQEIIDTENDIDRTAKVISGILSFIVGVFDTTANAISSAWTAVRDTTTSTWNGIRDFITGTLNGIQTFISGSAGAIADAILSPYRTARDGLGAIWNGISSVVEGQLNAIKGIIQGFYGAFRSGVNWIADKLGLGAVIPELPQFAQGGRSAGGLAIVGEQGPEIVDLPRGTNVMPNRESVGFLKAISGGLAIGGWPSVDDVTNALQGAASAVKEGVRSLIAQGAGPLVDQAMKLAGAVTPNLPGVFSGLGKAISQTLIDSLVDKVAAWLTGAQSVVSATGTGAFGQMLSGYTITQEFGMTNFAAAGAYAGGSHSGMDLAAPAGTPVMAADSGRVVSAGWNGSYGNYVAILHNGLKTAYAHMASITTALNAIVSKGDQIGTVGSTGYSTGPHLHFEVYDNGALVNPRNYYAFANGGHMRRGQPGIVGEQGWEMFVPDTAGTILSHDQSTAAMEGVTVNMPNATIMARDEADARRGANRVGWLMQVARARG